MAKCKIDECKRQSVARGFCQKHWMRWRNHGDATIVLKKRLPAECEVVGCDKKAKSHWEGRALCNMHYLRIWSYGTTDERERIFNKWSMCCIPDCDKPSRSPGEGNMCEMHYYRLRRTGTTKIIERKKNIGKHSCGYVLLIDTDHPLSNKRGGGLYEHRKVLFDAIGWGPHQCHWCGIEIDWTPGEKIRKGTLVPDHLNNIKNDNNINNLVPSCHKCNAARGLFERWVIDHQEDAVAMINRWLIRRDT